VSKLEAHDLIIIGAGPAAITAGIYAARYMMDFVIIGGLPGGTITLSSDLDNYPGFSHTTGAELTKNMVKHLQNVGHEIVQDSIKEIKSKSGSFVLTGATGKKYNGDNLLLAVGAEKNKLRLPNEDELCGKGISYCATCDGFFFKGLTVAVVGGGDAAAEAAVFLSDIAKKVYVILRRDEFRADPEWQKRLRKASNVEIIYMSQIKEIVGKEKLEAVVLDKDNRRLDLDGLFVEIGETPSSILFEQLQLKRDEAGYVMVDEGMRTSIDGVWAAGDSTTGSNKFRQIITACAEGAVAANTIYTKIRSTK
jgi:thioredoxin reductase (NADPH)